MNVFIAIIEEAYITIKMNDRNHWIYMYLKLDQNFVELKEDKTRKKIIDHKIYETDKREDSNKVTVIFKPNEKNNSMIGLDYFYNRVVIY